MTRRQAALRSAACALFLASLGTLAQTPSEPTSAAPPAPASPPATLEAVAKTLGSFEFLRADFRQARLVPALKKPLISSGHLLISRNDGFYWHLTTPLQSQIIMGKKALVKVDHHGRAQRLALDAEPALAGIVQVFAALMSADLKVLSQHFSMQISGSSADWTLVMTPADELSARLFAQVTLRGGDTLRQLQIKEQSGGQLQVDFTQVDTTVKALEASEKAAFARLQD